jgi:hypothetical protein
LYRTSRISKLSLFSQSLEEMIKFCSSKFREAASAAWKNMAKKRRGLIDLSNNEKQALFNQFWPKPKV